MLEDILKDRLKKLALIKKAGLDPYPATAERSHTASRAHEKFSALGRAKKKISLAGRITALRDQGNIIFADLADESGKIQIVLKKDNLAEFALWKSALDIGDFVSATGPLFKTQKGEESLEVLKLTLLTKSLRPIPSERYAIEDDDIRLRKRYLELITSPETKELFRKKTVFWESIRAYLKQEEFLEVEMSALENLPGGADAEPFKTHHNALDTDFYLRISLELPLKKLLIGGYEKVFEIGRVFRNEGIDKEHLQDYVQMELYWAYRNYTDLMELVERMYKHVVSATCGSLTTEWNGQKIQWGKTWPRVEYVPIFKKTTGIDPISASERELFQKAAELKLNPEKTLGKGKLIDLIYKKTVRPHLIQPCLLINHPVDVSPLSKRLVSNPNTVERVQVLACGSELGNGWSELNDPIDQRARFEEQMKLREAGDTEAQFLDEEFLEALEYGMPPAAGFGLSERLFAVLMDKPIRETVIFPLMRPKNEKVAHERDSPKPGGGGPLMRPRK